MQAWCLPLWTSSMSRTYNASIYLVSVTCELPQPQCLSNCKLALLIEVQLIASKQQVPRSLWWQQLHDALHCFIRQSVPFCGAIMTAAAAAVAVAAMSLTSSHISRF